MTMLGYDPRMEAPAKQVASAPPQVPSVSAEINENIYRAISVLDSCQMFLVDLFGVGILENEKVSTAELARSETDAIFTRLLNNSRDLATVARSMSVALTNSRAFTGGLE